ncbi:MAG: hypothetical protein HC880_09505 [Bacteroidia bacterium]|nr:hypothetical protein [Bacteroidia bacterium]
MKIFLDSSILIEFEKQTQTDSLLALQNSEHSSTIAIASSVSPYNG